MRRITLWLFSTVAALVLLFGYRTSTGTGSPAAVTTAAATAPASGSTYPGTVVQTRWGPVQVAVTVADGRITEVSVPRFPDGNGRDREINAYALPVLRERVLAAQSADIDAVSGATVTSDGYRESLQAALDAAHR
jgi:uncharacterized protein with FMN-binding domain